MYVITTDIFCDACQDWDPDVTRTGPKPRRADAMRRAKERGWVEAGEGADKRVFCPRCAPNADDMTDPARPEDFIF